MRNVMAVLLAGGRGRGLGVLTEHRATAALPFVGKYRLVDFSLSNCDHSEVPAVALLTQHAPTSLNEHVGSGRPWNLDRPPTGVMSLQPFAWREHAAWYSGAADALLRNVNAYENAEAVQVIVGSAEHVYPMDYSELVAAHDASRCPITIVVTPAPPQRGRGRHMVELRRDRLERIEHYPERTDLELAAIGVYVFDVDYLKALPFGPRRVLRDIVEPALAAKVPVNAFHFEGFWEDVRDLETYYVTSMAFLGPEPPLHLGDPRWRMETRGEERPPALFLPGNRSCCSLVAAGAVIEGEIDHSIIFGGVEVARGARVSNSIVFQDCRIAAGAVVDRAILDKQVAVEERAVVGDGPAPERDHAAALCVVGKEARVGPGERLPRGATVPLPASRARGDGPLAPAERRL